MMLRHQQAWESEDITCEVLILLSRLAGTRHLSLVAFLPLGSISMTAIMHQAIHSAFLP